MDNHFLFLTTKQIAFQNLLFNMPRLQINS